MAGQMGKIPLNINVLDLLGLPSPRPRAQGDFRCQASKLYNTIELRYPRSTRVAKALDVDFESRQCQQITRLEERQTPDSRALSRKNCKFVIWKSCKCQDTWELPICHVRS